MVSQPDSTDQQLTLSLAAAETLLGAAVRSTPVLASGANSRVIAIEADGRRYALKTYTNWRMTGPERCRAEWRALSYLHESGLTAVPRPIAHDPDQSILILEWIDGVPIAQVGDREIDEALGFLSRIFELSKVAGAATFSLASEACSSGQEIVRQIHARREEFGLDPHLERFLARCFDPVLALAIKKARSFCGFSQRLSYDMQCLIPADFGFHNALRERDGRIRFFDFDYFGWDDPVKLTADFLLHPAMHIADEQVQLFFDEMVALRSHDKSFTQRYYAYAALYALRWAIIVLNIFRPDREAFKSDGLTAMQKLVQLEKAQLFVERARMLV